MDVMEQVREHRRGFSLPRDLYVSAEAFELDVRRVFFRQWLFAGHQSQLPAPGSFFTYPLAQESIVLTRGEEGKIRGFFNVCRHRGARIVQEDCGSARSLVCPYHRWVYGLDGALRAAPNMNERLDKPGYGLHPVRVEVWNGLIYIQLGDDAPAQTIAQRLGRADEALKRHDLAHARVVKTIRYDVPANWKLFMENYRECYHCRGAHPQFCATVPVDQLDEHRGQENTRLIKAHDGTFTRYALKPHARSQSLDGQPVSIPFGTLTEHDTVLHALCFYPAHALVVGMDYAMAFSVQPVSPTRTTVTAHWLVSGQAVEGRDYDPDKVAAFWDVTNRQDVELCTINQQGVDSLRYEPGPYSAAQEDDVEHFVDYYLAQVGRE